ncbi:MAG: hypothetical protein ABSF35_21660 [Polyangia bacterium]
MTALGAGVVVLTAACEIAAGLSALADKGLTGDGVISFAAVGTAGRGGSAPARAWGADDEVKARAVVLGGSVAGLGVTDEVKARAVVLGGGVVDLAGAGDLVDGTSLIGAGVFDKGVGASSSLLRNRRSCSALRCSCSARSRCSISLRSSFSIRPRKSCST